MSAAAAAAAAQGRVDTEGPKVGWAAVWSVAGEDGFSEFPFLGGEHGLLISLRKYLQSDGVGGRGGQKEEKAWGGEKRNVKGGSLPTNGKST